MKCTFTPCGKHWHCERCGYTSKSTPIKPPVKECKPGLGDRVSQGLAAFGITKARVRWVKRQFGSIKPCGCDNRIAEINQAETMVRKLANSLLSSLKLSRGSWGIKKSAAKVEKGKPR